MKYRNMRGAVAACGATVLLLAVPAQSSACGWLDCLFGGWCGARSQTTYRVPVYTSPSAPQTCRYVPQTCYRTVCQQVPVTTFQPLTGCDPCTGCPVTTYRPVTTWTYQARLIPYTTYRPVYSNACDPCGGFATYAPVGSCIGCASETAVAEPSGYESGPAGSSMEPQPEPATSAPALETTPPARTFEESKPAGESPKELQSVPNTNLNSVPVQPQLSDPRGRVTSLPIRQAAYYPRVDLPPKPLLTRHTPIDDGGWRAVSDD